MKRFHKKISFSPLSMPLPLREAEQRLKKGFHFSYLSAVPFLIISPAPVWPVPQTDQKISILRVVSSTRDK
jgi:hypothetical protein